MDYGRLAKDGGAAKSERLEALLRAQLALHQPHWVPAGTRPPPFAGAAPAPQSR